MLWITLRAWKAALQLRQRVARVLLPAIVMPTMAADEVDFPPRTASVLHLHPLNPRRARRFFFGEKLAHDIFSFRIDF